MNKLRWLAAMVLGAILLSGATGCTTNEATGKTQLRFISKEQEIAIGNEAAPQFEEQFGGLMDAPTLQAYVDRVGQQVAQESPREMPYEFGLLRSSIPNAFALPGGKVYITGGLLQIMDSERQLAAVLGHEVGHVAAAHNVQGMQRQIGVQVLADLAGVAGGEQYGKAAETATKVVGYMATLKYSRSQEYEADMIGTRLMVDAGYNPYGMVELLEALWEASGQGESSWLGEMFSTHPLTPERIARVREQIQEEYPRYDQTTPDDRAQFEQMKTHMQGKLVDPPQQQ